MRSVHILLLILALMPGALAHTPFISEGGDDLERAVSISDPSKSWALYGELTGPDTAHYYRFEVDETDRIYLGLLRSTDPRQESFLPSMALMGPGLDSEGVPPGYVQVPDNASVVVVDGRRPDEATYEPFGPSSYYSLATLNLSAPGDGTYYVAVYAPQAGNYALVVGYRESFTLDEWLRLPLTMISVHRWEGQSIVLILAPVLVVVAAGAALIRQRPRQPSQTRWMALVAALLFMGTGASFLYQTGFALTRAPMVPEVAISLLLGLMTLALGAVTARIALAKRGDFDKREKLKLRIVGLAALLLGAGLLVGPLLAIASSTLRSEGVDQKRAKGKRERSKQPVKKGKRG